MSDADWEKDLAQRAVVTADHNKRRTIQRQQDAKLTKAAFFASYAASQGDSGGEGFIAESAPAAATSGPTA
jgi:hypothetical protein